MDGDKGGSELVISEWWMVSLLTAKFVDVI
jgi:hypothetical protein